MALIKLNVWNADTKFQKMRLLALFKYKKNEELSYGIMEIGDYSWS